MHVSCPRARLRLRLRLRAAAYRDGVGADDTTWTWEPWSPSEVARRLDGVTAPWAVAGGWALDLFRGEVTRPHDDTEIAVPSAGFPAIAAALDAEVTFQVAGDGRLWTMDDVTLSEHFQTWARDRRTGTYRLDVFRDQHDGDVWICRRSERLRRPYRELIGYTADGIPYQVPEIGLLFKAKYGRPKDQADLDGVLPLLSPAQRDWLRDAIRLVHPAHRWLDLI